MPDGQQVEAGAVRTHLSAAGARARQRETDFSNPETVAVWTLRLFLATMAGQSLYVTHYAESNQQLVFLSAVSGLVLSGLFLFVPTERPRTLKLLELGTLLAFCLHVAGHLYAWYVTVPFYDKALHVWGGFIVVWAAFAASQCIPWLWNWRSVTPRQVFFLALVLSLAVGVVWEFVEYGMDSLFGTREQAGLDDTMQDLLADTAGAALGAFGVAKVTAYARHNGAHRVAEERKPDPAPDAVGQGVRRGAA